MNAWTGNKRLYKLGCADSWIDSLQLRAVFCAHAEYVPCNRGLAELP